MKLEEMPRAPLFHALILVILVIGASEAERLSAPTSSNGTASNQPASNGTLNQTRAAYQTDPMVQTDDGHWTYRVKETRIKDICAEEAPCRSKKKCTCQKMDEDAYYCKYNTTHCEEAGPPCYNGRKNAGDCCKSCPNGPNCLLWGTLIQPGKIFQNPGDNSEYAMCGKTGFMLFQVTEWDEKSGLPTNLRRGIKGGARYP